MSGTRSKRLRMAPGVGGLLVVILVASGAVAAGADDPSVTPGPGGGSYVSTQKDGRPLGSQAQLGYAGTSLTGPPPTYFVDFFDGLAPEDGTFEHQDGCWGISIAEGGGGMTWAEAQAKLAEYNDPQAWGACAAEETFDLATYVLESWRSVVRPPPPTPLAVAPGHVVTGLRSYLEIGGDPNPVETLPNPIGPAVTISMTPRYVVTWGDGASEETASQGVPWPGGAGEITHVYSDEGEVSLVVRAFWTGTWTAGGAGGTLPELPNPTTATLELPVEEYQARTD